MKERLTTVGLTISSRPDTRVERIFWATFLNTRSSSNTEALILPASFLSRTPGMRLHSLQQQNRYFGGASTIPPYFINCTHIEAAVCVLQVLNTRPTPCPLAYLHKTNTLCSVTCTLPLYLCFVRPVHELLLPRAKAIQ